MSLQEHCNGCIYHYLILANMAVASNELMFPIRPKLHVKAKLVGFVDILLIAD